MVYSLITETLVQTQNYHAYCYKSCAFGEAINYIIKENLLLLRF